MVYEEGEIKVINPGKEIATEIVVEMLMRHRDALIQSRSGKISGIPLEKIRYNQRKLNQVRGLSLMISAQKDMITYSRAIIYNNSNYKWKKKYNTDEDRLKFPFEKEINDYNDLKNWLKFLEECEQSIINADKTKTLDDDFMIEKTTNQGIVRELTHNFYEMLSDLETSYERINLLMLTNKVISAGIEHDDEMEYIELENEAIRRIVEA